MSLYGVMRTGVSGMNAQASRLSSVADNIANADTTGYKRTGSEFSSMVLTGGFGQYQSGGVNIAHRQFVIEQGTLQYSTSATDLAISGDGFFVVEDPNGGRFLTRAGSFVPDAEGNLVNAAGFRLLGHGLANGVANVVANGFDGLSAINIDQRTLSAEATTTGLLAANLPAGADVIAPAQLPGANAAGSIYTAKTSVITYDALGAEITLDIYFAKTGSNAWEAAVYDRAGAAANGGFPYASGPLALSSLGFDGTTGMPTGGGTLDVPIPGGETAQFDLGDMRQLATGFSVTEARVDGHAPSVIEDVQVASDGMVTGVLRNGTRVPLAQIALADVPSPDLLERHSGNVFAVTDLSGDVLVGMAESGGLGTIVGGALEQSTVDIASELTEMIQSQRTYTANSKVFMTGADLMDVLVNLKR